MKRRGILINSSEILDIDNIIRSYQTKMQVLQEKRNKASKEIGQMIAQGSDISDLKKNISDYKVLKEICEKLNLKFELDVLNSTDSIITTVGDRYQNIIKEKLSNSKKIHKIYNGYDKSVYDKIKEIKPTSFNIVFTGVLSKNHNYQVFNKVLSHLKDEFNDLNMIFTFAGKIDKEIKKLYSEKIHFIDRGYVIHETAIEIIKSSHLLINFNYLNTEKTDMVSGKLIEYLASGSPIINFSNSAEESNSLLKKLHKIF